MSMTKHSCKLMFYKYFSIEEMYEAMSMLDWFAEEAMSGKEKFDVTNNKWIINPSLQLPSWKHLTKGGHSGINIGRGGVGTYMRYSKDPAADGLIFRRHSRDQRIFVVQYMKDLDVSSDLMFRLRRRQCICRACVSETRVKSKLKLEDFQLYKEL